jgi:hypothetical protein
MKKTTGAMNQEGIDLVLDFVREHALVEEVGDKPAVTSKGERLLDELGSAGLSSSAAAGGP